MLFEDISLVWYSGFDFAEARVLRGLNLPRTSSYSNAGVLEWMTRGICSYIPKCVAAECDATLSHPK